MDRIDMLKSFVDAADKALKDFQAETAPKNKSDDWRRLAEILDERQETSINSLITIVANIKKAKDELATKVYDLEVENRELKENIRLFKNEVEKIALGFQKQFNEFEYDIEDVLGRH